MAKFLQTVGSFIVVALILFPHDVSARETNITRVAVGPFFAPPHDQPLARTAAMLPDLLTVRLSHDKNFQLLERRQILDVWREANLTVQGLDAADAVVKLGRILACDQFVSGSFITTGTNTLLWVRYMDVHNAVLIQLQPLPFNSSNLEATVNAITSFMDQSCSIKTSQRFVALGGFLDMSITSGREDWSSRLRTLIESKLNQDGYGVVDLETVSPIFDEFQLEQAGLSEVQTNRVKLQPSFWMVDGRTKWVRDTEDKLSVAIRVHKVGSGDAVLNFRAKPGDELASNIVRSVENELSTNPTASLQQAAREQTKIFDDETLSAVHGKTQTSPPRYSTNDFISFYAQRAYERMGEAFQEAQRAWLADSNNLAAKWIVASFYFAATNDAATRERGVQMLNELARSTNRTYALGAYLLLTRGQGAYDRNGKLIVVVPPASKPDPAIEYQINEKQRETVIREDEEALRRNPSDKVSQLSLAWEYYSAPDAAKHSRGRQMLNTLATNADEKLAAQARLYLGPEAPINNKSRNKAASQSSAGDVVITAATPGVVPIQRSQCTLVDSISEWPIHVLQDNGWLISRGSKLSYYDYSGGKRDVEFPTTHAISAMAADADAWWVGTDGGGLSRVPKSGGPIKTWTEADGLLLPVITALSRQNDRLWIGFSFRGSGGLGYLDLKTEKFVAYQHDVDFTPPAPDVSPLVDAPVDFIQMAGPASLWVGGTGSLREFDTISQKVLRTITPVTGGITISSNYVVITSRRGGTAKDILGLKIYNLANGQIQRTDLLGDEIGPMVTALCADGQRVWVASSPDRFGGDTSVALIDLPSRKIAARYAVHDVNWVFWMGAINDEFWFLAGLGGTKVDLLRLNKNPAQQLIPGPAVDATVTAGESHSSSRNDDKSRLELLAFLQSHFSELVPVQFVDAKDGTAVLQRFSVKNHLLDYGGQYICGIRFTMPSWSDGDFAWLYSLAKNAAEKDFSTHTFWGIISETGELEGFDSVDQEPLEEYPILQKQLPYTHTLNIQSLPNGRLKPGHTYAIWFGIQERNHPDMAFAMTIMSQRGVREYGLLPLK